MTPEKKDYLIYQRTKIMGWDDYLFLLIVVLVSAYFFKDEILAVASPAQVQEALVTAPGKAGGIKN